MPAPQELIIDVSIHAEPEDIAHLRDLAATARRTGEASVSIGESWIETAGAYEEMADKLERGATGPEIDATAKGNPLRSCRVCGCTADRACLVDGLMGAEGCSWAEDGLCSACVGVTAVGDTYVAYGATLPLLAGNWQRKVEGPEGEAIGWDDLDEHSGTGKHFALFEVRRSPDVFTTDPGVGCDPGLADPPRPGHPVTLTGDSRLHDTHAVQLREHVSRLIGDLAGKIGDGPTALIDALDAWPSDPVEAATLWRNCNDAERDRVTERFGYAPSPAEILELLEPREDGLPHPQALPVDDDEDPEAPLPLVSDMVDDDSPLSNAIAEPYAGAMVNKGLARELRNYSVPPTGEALSDCHPGDQFFLVPTWTAIANVLGVPDTDLRNATIYLATRLQHVLELAELPVVDILDQPGGGRILRVRTWTPLDDYELDRPIYPGREFLVPVDEAPGVLATELPDPADATVAWLVGSAALRVLRLDPSTNVTEVRLLPPTIDGDHRYPNRFLIWVAPWPETGRDPLFDANLAERIEAATPPQG